MTKKVKSFFNKKDLRVLSNKEAKQLKGGNVSTSSTSNQSETTEIVIEEIIQI